MDLKGSCRCGAVRFSLQSHTPVPYQLCYCSICRKTAGGGGYAINLMGVADTLAIEGREHARAYHATIDRGGSIEHSPAERWFCSQCATALWLFDPRWPELVHPFASAIDSELPVAPARVHLMLGSKPDWVEPQFGPGDERYDEYPELSIEEWHRKHRLWID